MQRPRDAELMGEYTIGIYLSREPLCESNQTVEENEPKLRRFVTDQESIQRPETCTAGRP